MSMNPPFDDEDEALAAEYVAGVLPLGERMEFEQRLSESPALRQAVRVWEQHLSPLLETVAPVTPPAQILSAIEARLFGQPPAQTGWAQSLTFWRSLSLGSLFALALLSLLYAGALGPRTATTANYVAQLTGPQQAVAVAVLYDAKAQELRFNRLSGSPVSGRSYQLWLIAGKDAPVSMGVLPDAANGTVKVNAALAGKLPGAVLAISDEPAGGSPTGQPTGAVLATGNLATI